MVELDAGGQPPGSDLDALHDEELIALVRRGHDAAFGILYSRYSYPAYRLARHLGQRDDSDDVVSEAFARVLALLKRGKGPDTAFRAYLFTTVRHESASRAKFRARVMPTDDASKIDSTVPFGDGQLDGFERNSVRAAYESLPPRWRSVLWHIEVEGRKPVDVGAELALSPNSISALVYRARAALREAYVQQHINAEAPVGGPACGALRPKLSALVRETASDRDRRKLTEHLDVCHACMIVFLDLVEVNRSVDSGADRRPQQPPD